MLTTSGHAQTAGQGWQVSQADPRQPPVAIVPGSGSIVAMGLACDGPQAFILVDLVRPLGTGRANGALTVDGRSFPLAFNVTAQPARLFGPVTDPALIAALAGGRTVAVSVGDRAIGALTLAGSSQALSKALAGCWQNSVTAFPKAEADPAQRLPLGEGPSPVVPVADRAAIMRAAGFTLRKGKWATCEGEETGEIVAFEDIDGDGTKEALIASFGTACHGFGGSGYTLLTRINGAWSILIQGSGMPSFYRRGDGGWPDIEIGGPGSNCFPLLRWDGTKYVRAGTSLEGRVCTLDPPFDRAPAAMPVVSAAAATAPSAQDGILGRIPVRLGYYVEKSRTTCAAPTYLYKFERNRHLEIASAGARVEVLRYDYGRVIGQEDGFYRVSLADPGPEDLPDIGIRPTAAGGIDLLSQGIVSLIPCPEGQIPARMKR
ncbi:hypothetical protein [Erythrobacter donghaensis]|uniref:hypothetical protein n=1 Tax=Erythrobacter donghaensis TaxID=267135 RepID=UPI00117DC270|nr:hypothetical protein [Erythrobacter donghaensis]